MDRAIAEALTTLDFHGALPEAKSGPVALAIAKTGGGEGEHSKAEEDDVENAPVSSCSVDSPLLAENAGYRIA